MRYSHLSLILMDAITDAQRDNTWYGAGFLFGVFGIGAAYVATPSVPPRRLLGKCLNTLSFIPMRINKQ